MRFDWSAEKSEALRARHGVGFGDVLVALQDGRLLADIPHPSANRYPGQRILVVLIDDYVHAVPYVLDGEIRFLKTLFPSRRLHREFGGKR